MGQQYDNVWDALSDTPEEARNLTMRSDLMIALSEHLKARGLSQAEAAEILDVTQPRISDLMNSKIDRFSLDTLINLADRAGLPVSLRIGDDEVVA
jgi:predicted XRE-type DNA-binding protein